MCNAHLASVQVVRYIPKRDLLAIKACCVVMIMKYQTGAGGTKLTQHAFSCLCGNLNRYKMLATVINSNLTEMFIVYVFIYKFKALITSKSLNSDVKTSTITTTWKSRFPIPNYLSNNRLSWLRMEFLQTPRLQIITNILSGRLYTLVKYKQLMHH